MLLTPTAGSAHVGSFSRPGCLSDAEGPGTVGEHADLGLQQHEPDQRGDGDAGGDGRGEDGAEEPMPRRCLSASTARPMPSAMPIGTVMSANTNVSPSAWWNSFDCEHVDSTGASRRRSCLPLKRRAQVQAEPDGAAERVEDEHAEDHEGGQQEDEGAAAPPGSLVRLTSGLLALARDGVEAVAVTGLGVDEDAPRPRRGPSTSLVRATTRASSGSDAGDQRLVAQRLDEPDRRGERTLAGRA